MRKFILNTGGTLVCRSDRDPHSYLEAGEKIVREVYCEDEPLLIMRRSPVKSIILALLSTTSAGVVVLSGFLAARWAGLI